MPTKVTPQSFSGILHEHYDDSFGTVVDANSNITRSWSDSFTGVDQPDWRKIIARGGNATTSASWYRREYLEDFECGFRVDEYFWNGSEWQWWKTYHRKFRGPAEQRPLVLDDSLIPASNAEVNARTKFLQQIRQAQTAFQGGTFLGELRETLGMLRRPAKALRDGIDSYARAAKKVARSRQSNNAKRKALGGTWLEYQFGWVPLVNDIHDLSKAIRKQTSNRKVIILQSEASESSYSREEGTTATMSLTREWAFDKIIETSVRYKGGISMAFDAPTSVMAKYGLNWSNFIPTVYELIPYSFLVDYFSNIGNLIDAACVSNFQIAWGCGTVVQRASESCSKYNQPKIASTDSWRYRSLGDSVHSYVNRVSKGERWSFNSLGVGVGDLRLRLPIASSTKWLNIGALALQRRG